MDRNTLSSFVSSYELDNKTEPQLPRGFMNSSNYCYMNSCLQALLSVPQFFNLFKSLQNQVSEYEYNSSNITKSMVDIVSKYSAMKPNKKKLIGHVDAEVPIEARDLQFYSSLKSGRFERGVQEDASDFLTFVLDQLDNEMLTTLNNNGVRMSPINKLFQGFTVTENETPKEEPFVVLPVDIIHEKVHSVETAFLRTFRANGFTDSSTIRAQESLQILPEVMIVQLKIFSYKKNYGATKSTKYIDIQSELTIPDEILSQSAALEYSAKKKQYKLCAVIYHDGYDMFSGHYVTDSYHTGCKSWLNYNDGLVKSVVSPSEQYNHESCCPYILIYRRKDTFGNYQNKTKSNVTSGICQHPQNIISSKSNKKKNMKNIKSIEEPQLNGFAITDYNFRSSYHHTPYHGHQVLPEFNKLSISNAKTLKKNKSKKK